MATRKAPARTTKARTTKRSTKTVEPVGQETSIDTESTTTRVSRENTSSNSVTSNIISRKNAPIFITILGVVLLGFLAYRYLVVAWVDQTPITRFQLYSQLEKKYGSDITEQLITEDLIKNEAKKRNVDISDDEIKAELTKIEEQQGGPRKLDEILGLTKNDP